MWLIKFWLLKKDSPPCSLLVNRRIHLVFPLFKIVNRVAQMGEKRNAYRFLMGKPEGKRPIGKPRRSWEDNVRMDLSEIGWGGMDWVDLAEDRDQWRALVNTVMNLRVP
jgi:hypothetical protein